MSQQRGRSRSAVVGPFRCSFPHLAKPRAAVPGAEEKYSITLLLPDAEAAKPLAALAAEAARSAWGEKWRETLTVPLLESAPRGSESSPFRDASRKSLEGYGDVELYVSVKAQGDRPPPPVFDGRNSPADPSAILPGYWVYASVEAYTWEVAGKRGIAFGLRAVRFARKDSVFGGAAPADGSEFEGLAQEDAAWDKEPAGDFARDVFGDL